jgi:uncharacterized protein DUF4304
MSVANESTAQATYADMLRTSIAPRLRALGFKGSGARYILPDADRWLIVAFQKDKYSRSDWVGFTVNVTAAAKAAWAEARAAQAWLPSRPSGNSNYPVEKTTVLRLGNLMASGEDRWWEVTPGRPTMLAVIEVLDAIEHLATPWLRAQFAGGQLESTRDIRRR